MKSLYFNRISKEWRIYTLGVLLIPLAVAVAGLAWAGGNLRTAVIFGAVSVGWSIFIILLAREISRRRDKTHHAPDRTPRRIRMIILLRIFVLFTLVGGVVGLATALVKDKPLYVILEAVWIIMAGILLIAIVTDE